MDNEKILVFDMDGTIADLYGVDGWLEDLRNQNPRPYEIARPLYDTDTLNEILNLLRVCGWKVVVTTWLAKESTAEYKKAVAEAKTEWLKKFNFPYDEIHIVQYGTTKANCTRKLGGYQILVDDNEKVRKGWHLGGTINANENILPKLVDLLVA
jgi:hydroxymethylpyrimidine pyrophosphatase-like HAD family hydrolase